MRFKLMFFGLALFFSGCNRSLEKKEPTVVEEQQPLRIDKESIQLYQLNQYPLVDSVLIPIEKFSVFRATMEDLTKLNPTGIEPFLYEALLKCDDLLRQKLPSPFSTPDIKSRLKVVKTELIKARYYGQEADQEKLNEALKKLYIAYNAYLMRIEDFALTSSEQISMDVNKTGALE